MDFVRSGREYLSAETLFSRNLRHGATVASLPKCQRCPASRPAAGAWATSGCQATGYSSTRWKATYNWGAQCAALCGELSPLASKLAASG